MSSTGRVRRVGDALQVKVMDMVQDEAFLGHHHHHMSNPTSPKDDLLSSPLSPTSSGSLRNIRGSIDSERSVRSPNGINGHASRASEDSTHDPSDIIARLKHELEQITEEKAALQVQHNNVLSKVHTMRTTLGNKLKQDAVRSPTLCSVYQLIRTS